MTLLAGAVAFGEPRAVHEMAERLARRTARYGGLAPDLLHQDSGISLFHVARAADKPEPLRLSDRAGGDTWIVGDIAYADQPLRDRVVKSNQHVQPLDLKIPGRWIGVEVGSNGPRLRLVTDSFGSNWLYLTQTPDGIYFSSDFGALAGLIGEDLTIDDEAVLFELCLGFLPGERTLYKEISIAPPGAILELGRTGIKETARRRPAYGDAGVGLTQEQKFHRLDEIFDAMFAGTVKTGFAQDMVLSLSAGFDSRFCLAFFGKHGIAADFCTFGHPDSKEVERAQRLAGLFGQQSEVFHFAQSDWSSWRRSAQQLGMLGTVQWSGWAEAWFEVLRRHGHRVAIGYLGDHLTGKKLAFDGSKDWLPAWAASKMDGEVALPRAGQDLLRPAARTRVERGFAELLMSQVEQADTGLPHQGALHLNLFGRQRRRVAAQPNLISRHLTPVVPLFCDDLMTFFMNLDQSDLENQRLYRAYGQDRFPELFSKDERRKPSIGARVLRKGLRLTKSLVTGEGDRARPIVIDRDRMIDPNRENIVDLARKAAPRLDEIFDMERFCHGVAGYGGSDGLSSSTILAMTSLLHLVDLSQGSAAKDD